VERPRKFLHQNFHECLISAYLFSAESSLLVFDAPEATVEFDYRELSSKEAQLDASCLLPCSFSWKERRKKSSLWTW
jgi:hypothetical protein